MNDPAVAPRHRGRSIASLLLFVLATVLLVPAILGHWGDRTVVDTDRYVNTVGPLIEQPAVQDALAAAVTDQIVTRVDTEKQVESLLTGVLPDSRLTNLLVAPITSGINGLIGDLVTKFVASEQFATIWVEFNRTAQQSAVAMLKGRNDGIVQLQGDNLVLDVSTALQAIQTHLVDSGITAAANIPLPTTSRTVVLANTPVLAQVRTIYQIAGPALHWLPLIIALLFILAIVLARWRARTVVATGVVLVAAMALLLLSVRTAEVAITEHLSTSPWAGAVDAFWWTLLEFLIAGAQGFIALGVVLVAAGWLGGRTTSGRWVRGRLTRGLGDLTARTHGGILPAAALPWLRALAYAIGLVLLFTADVFSVSTVLWISALVAGLVALITYLGPPPAPTATALEPAPVPVPTPGAVPEPPATAFSRAVTSASTTPEP